MPYICPKCNGYFLKKRLFDGYQDNEVKCKGNPRQLPPPQKKLYVCQYCCRAFPNIFNRNRHDDTCKKKEEDTNSDDTSKHRYSEKKSNNPINIVDFGEEGINHLTNKDILEIFNPKKVKSGTGLIKSLIVHVNFNKNKPKYHNMLYTDNKSGNCSVFRENHWDGESIMDTLNILIDNRLDDLQKLSNSHFINDDHRILINQAIEYYNFKELYARSTLITSLKPLICSYQGIVKLTKKLWERQQIQLSLQLYRLQLDQ